MCRLLLPCFPQLCKIKKLHWAVTATWGTSSCTALSPLTADVCGSPLCGASAAQAGIAASSLSAAQRKGFFQAACCKLQLCLWLCGWLLSCSISPTKTSIHRMLPPTFSHLCKSAAISCTPWNSRSSTPYWLISGSKSVRSLQTCFSLSTTRISFLTCLPSPHILATNSLKNLVTFFHFLFSETASYSPPGFSFWGQISAESQRLSFNLLSSFLFSSLFLILKIYEKFPEKHSIKELILKKNTIHIKLIIITLFYYLE